MRVGSSLPEFKVVLAGTQAVGKTSIIMRYCDQGFSDDRQSTIGSAFISHHVTTRHGEAILQIWDTAGQERYRSLVPMYSRGAVVAIVVFDVTSPESFEDLDEWISQVRDKANQNCEIVVAGNKCDLERVVTEADVDAWMERRDFVNNVVYVSSKTGSNIERLFDMVCEQIPGAAFHLAAEVPLKPQAAPAEGGGCC
jgi:small GTP-binding protein